MVDDRFERLHGPASISGRTLPPGDYDFRFWEAFASTNEARMFSVSLEGSGAVSGAGAAPATAAAGS